MPPRKRPAQRKEPVGEAAKAAELQDSKASGARAAKRSKAAKAGPTEKADAAEADDRPKGLDAWERRLWGEGHAVIAGTDEAGRGPLAGPVVSGAFAVLPAGREDAKVMELLQEVTDSKALSETERDGLFARLTDPSLTGKVAWSIVEVSSSEIDETNILKASLTSMSRAVCELDPRPDCVLVDGCNRPPDLLRKGEQWTRGSKASEMAKADAKQQRLGSFFGKAAPKAAPTAAAGSREGSDAPWRPKAVECVIEGDGRVPCISAASVLAKVQRDRVMKKLHEEYPQYGFADHKGYGTKVHMEAIAAHGLTPAHRRSFAPVKEALPAADGQREESGLRLLQSLGMAGAGVASTPERRGKLSEGASTSKEPVERAAGGAEAAAKGPAAS